MRAKETLITALRAEIAAANDAHAHLVDEKRRVDVEAATLAALVQQLRARAEEQAQVPCVYQCIFGVRL